MDWLGDWELGILGLNLVPEDHYDCRDLAVQTLTDRRGYDGDGRAWWMGVVIEMIDLILGGIGYYEFLVINMAIEVRDVIVYLPILSFPHRDLHQ